MQGAPPLASPRLSRRKHGLTLRNRYPAGACPAGCRLTVPLWCPQGGGLPSLPPANPSFSFLYCPHPHPLPGGKGENQVYFMQGAPPLASPRLSRRQHGLNLRYRCPTGGLPSLPPARPAFSLLSFPHPPSPLPLRGRGRLLLFLCKGLRPLHPRG